MAHNNSSAVFLYFAICILIGITYGFAMYYHFRILEKFTGSDGPAGQLLFFYLPNCPHTEAAKKIFEEIDTQGRLEKVMIDCSGEPGMSLCKKENIAAVPAFKVVTPRVSERITDWRKVSELNAIISKALTPISVNVVLTS